MFACVLFPATAPFSISLDIMSVAVYLPSLSNHIHGSSTLFDKLIAFVLNGLL